MTALTGETGAGKTLVVEAIELLVGGRADAVLVRPGAEEAWVEGRFDTPEGTDVVLARAIPATGAMRPSTYAWPRWRRWPSGVTDWSTCTASTPTSRCSPRRC